MSDNKKLTSIIIPAAISLTLGLAPFVPEPHIYKQFLNILNGTFTEPMDWFDLVLHGFPWIWLVYSIVQYFRK